MVDSFAIVVERLKVDIRKWILAGYLLPERKQKIYYFSENLGIFLGTYNYDSSSKGNPHKFISKHGIVDRDDISYWMPYDHSLRDMIPLPPDYKNENIIEKND